MRFPSLWRLSIPAASLVVALHAGTALACPGFPNATENCGLTFVALGQQPLGTAAEHLSLTFSQGMDLDEPASLLFSSDDGSGPWFEWQLVSDDPVDFGDDDDFERIALDIFGDDVGPDTPPPPPPAGDEPPDIESVIPDLTPWIFLPPG